MRPLSIKIRSISIFVLAFLCLNVGGAVCLSVCTKAVHAKGADHSTMDMPAGGHCSRHGHEKMLAEQQPSAPAADSTRCCSLSIALFAAPLEKSFAQFELAPAAALPLVVITRPGIPVERIVTSSDGIYRPPALDLRINRTKFCVIRI